MEIKTIFIFFLVTLISSVNTEILASEVSSQEIKTFSEQVKSIKKQTNVKSYQSDNKVNQIPYFDNRFRIDAELDEITLLFYRNRGSLPIILVRPDGSKLSVDNIDHKTVQWHDDSTFDLIKIQKPMPGPWQAIGNILPESHIMVMSDVKMEVAPLPEFVLSGETLKVVGKLYNGDEPINTPYFRHVVELDVHFYSTNNSNYENFGADALKLTSFRDDGHDLDEYAGDGLFTGEFRLDFAVGEWQPVFMIKLPMATRELKLRPLVLLKPPINIDVDVSENKNNPHIMTLTINPAYVDANSLVFQGSITFPSKQIEAFSIMGDQQGVTRVKQFKNTESGVYHININAFGKSTSGRDLRLTVPEFSFNVKANDEYLMTTIDENGVEKTISVDRAQKLLADREAELAQAKIAQQLAEEEKEMQSIIMIAAGNAIVIVVAIVLFLVMRRKKNKALK